MRQPLWGHNPARRKSPGGNTLWRATAAVLLLLGVGLSGLPPTILFEVEASESPLEERENEKNEKNEKSEEFVGSRSPLRVTKHRPQASFPPVDHTCRCHIEAKSTRSGGGHFLPNGLLAPLIC
ncbi:MAG: hypothetical protein CMJ45_05650 [Planctomyces sp.]|nr:hypothetical protein [Planctomyces sp.]MDP7274725.1 hypothetical protein [Planctomycetaceae bacterium]